MTDLTPALTLLTAYNPRFCDRAPVRAWMEAGADLHLDIIPVIREWTARKQDIYSVGFFTKYVRQARDARLNAPEPITDRQRAERVAFLTRRLGRSLPTDERWLAAFEAKHGEVA